MTPYAIRTATPPCARAARPAQWPPMPHPAHPLSAFLLAAALALPGAAAAPARAQAAAPDWAAFDGAPFPTDSLRDHLGRVRAALLALEKHPGMDQPLPLRATVTVESRTGVRRLRIRDFQFLSDGARNTAEYNLGPGSWPTLVGVLGSAVAQEFVVQAARRGIPLDALEVVFTGRPGSGSPGAGAARVTYPRDLTYTAHLVSPAPDAQLEDLRRAVEQASPILQLLRTPQPIAPGTLELAPSPAERRARSLDGLREFLADKRAASAGARPPEAPSRFETRRPPAPGEPPLRAHVTIAGGTGLRHIRTDVSDFQLLHDSPRYLAGHNLAPTAEEHMLGVMITCLAHIYEIQAAQQQVALDALELEVEGTLTSRPGRTEPPPRFRDLRYRVYLTSPEPRERIARLQAAVEASCPIYNLLKDGQPIQGQIVRGLPAATVR